MAPRGAKKNKAESPQGAPVAATAAVAVVVPATATAKAKVSQRKTGGRAWREDESMLSGFPRVWTIFIKEKYTVSKWGVPLIRAYMLDHYHGDLKVPSQSVFYRYVEQFREAAESVPGGNKVSGDKRIAMRREGEKTELELRQTLASFRLSEMDFSNQADLLESTLRSMYVKVEYLNKVNESMMDVRYEQVAMGFYGLIREYVKDLNNLAMIGEWNEYTATLIIEKYQAELSAGIKRACDKVLGADPRARLLIQEIRKADEAIDIHKLKDIAVAEVAAAQKNGPKSVEVVEVPLPTQPPPARKTGLHPR